MAAKILCVLLLALVSQGYCGTQIILDEHTVNHISSDLIGTSFTIPKFMFDRLVSCFIVLPNGILYEAFPEDKIPHEQINFMDAVEPFRSCAVSLRGVAADVSGTYELYSLVESSTDLTETLTRQKFTINVVESEVEVPTA